MKRKVLISVLAIALVLTLCIGMFVACDPKDSTKSTKYTVTYSLGDYQGTGTAPAAQEVEAGSKTKLPEVGATWTGHKFTGWKAGEGELLAAGTEVEVTADVTYIAQWEEESNPPTQQTAPKVTVYGVDGTKLGEEQSVEWEGKYSIYSPAAEYELEAAEETYFTYQLYDPETKEKKGAFNYREFEADGDISIIVVAESIGEPATSIDAKWLGNYYSESKTGSISTAEITERKIDVMLVGEMETLNPNGLTMFKAIWLKDGSYVIGEQHDIDPEDPQAGKTNPVYYALSLSEDGNTLTVSNLTDPEDGPYPFTRKAEYTVTVHYTLAGTEKTDTMKTMSADGKGYMLNPPLEALDDAGALMEELKMDETYGIYYYDSAASDKKGEKFDNSYFEATANFDIIIVKEKIGFIAGGFDSSWFGAYSGTSSFFRPYTLKIYQDQNGAYTFILNDAMQDWTGNASENILMTMDGKLVLACEDEYSANGYKYFYFTQNADGSITLDYDEGTVTLNKQKVTATIYYSLNGQVKSVTADAIPNADEGYKLESEPEWYIDDPDYTEFTSALTLGKVCKYYDYADNKKGAEIKISDFTFESNVSILIEIAKVGDPAHTIQDKFVGMFTGTSRNNDLTLTILQDAVKLDFGDGEWVPDPIEAHTAKKEDGSDATIFITEDGRLVFAEISGSYIYYYYFSANENGTYTLDTENEKNISLMKKRYTVDIYYMMGDEMKSTVAEAIPEIGGRFTLAENPEWYIDDADYDAYMADFVYGTSLKYYFFSSKSDDYKGSEFDIEGTFMGNIAIILDIEKFADPVESIDEKFTDPCGTFFGTCDLWGNFTLTIDAEKGTIKLDYGDDKEDPNPVESSIEDGTILLTTEDGKLVFVEEAWNQSVANAHYYFLTANEDGTFTLDSEYYEDITLTPGYIVKLNGADEYSKDVLVKEGEFLTIPEDFPMTQKYSDGTHTLSFRYLYNSITQRKFDYITNPITANIKLTAQYDAKITYDLNGATQSEEAPLFDWVEASDYYYGYNDSHSGLPTLDQLHASYEGFRFAGWKRSDTGEIKNPGEYYYDDDTWKGTKFSYDITFTAQWKEIKESYTITYKADGNDSFATQTVNHGATTTAPTPAPTYNQDQSLYFAFWAIEGTEDEFSFSTEIMEDYTLVAIYRHFFSFDIGEGAQGTAPAPQVMGKSTGNYTMPDSTGFSKQGQKLVGWTLKDDKSGKVYRIGEEGSYGNGAKNETFVAKWMDASIQYTITYQPGDHATGNNITSKVDPYTEIQIEQSTFTPAENYPYFKYWEVVGEEDSHKDPGDKVVITADLTLKAVYSSELFAEKSSSNLNVLKLDLATKTGTFSTYSLTFELGEQKDDNGYQDITLTINFADSDKQHVDTAKGKVNIEKETLDIVIYYDYSAWQYGSAKAADDLKTPLNGYYSNENTNLTFAFLKDGTMFAGRSTPCNYYQIGESKYMADYKWMEGYTYSHYYLTIEKAADGSLTITIKDDLTNSGTYKLGGGTEIKAKTYTQAKKNFQLTISAEWNFKLVDGQTSYDGTYFELYENNYYAISGDNWFKFEVKDSGDIYCSSSSLTTYSWETFVAPIDLNEGEVTYTGNASWKSGSGFFAQSYSITKISIDPTKEVTTCVIEYTTDGKTTNARITIENITASLFTGKYDDHKISYYYQYNSGGLAFTIAIYDDGTLMVGDRDDNYLATFEKQA